mgnify:CR=1 FL=1
MQRLQWNTATNLFGAVLVKDGEAVYTNENQIYTATDPTFHAEAGLIRRFCKETGITDLSDYTLYSSCEPCFMCCGAMVWVKAWEDWYMGRATEISAKSWASRGTTVRNWYLKDLTGDRSDSRRYAGRKHL